MKAGVSMKKFFSVTVPLICLFFVLVISLSSCDFFNDFANRDFIFTDLGDSYEFSGLGDCMEEDIIVPEKYKGKPVTAIGDRAFYRNLLTAYYKGIEYPNIKSVQLPNTITKIGIQAFAECRYLTSLQIPETVVEIGPGAFYCCIRLESINLPEGIKEIGESMFDTCKSLKSINIPQTVNKLGISAFKNCELLNEIILPANVTVIPASCFYNTGLTSFTISEQITEIGYNAFGECKKLNEITIPNTVEVLGQYIFDKTEENLTVYVNYDYEPQEGWAEKWYYGTAGKVLNTSEAYFNNVIKANIIKAQEKQQEIDLQNKIIKGLEDERDRYIELRNALGGVNPNETLLAAYEKQIILKNREIREASEILYKLKEELKEIKTTNQIN